MSAETPVATGVGPAQRAVSVDEALAAASQAHRDTTRLIRMLTVLGEAGDVSQVLERALYTMSELFDIEAVVALSPLDDDELQVLSECGLGEDLAAAAPRWACPPAVCAALDSGEPVTTSGATLPAELDELGVRDVLWLPASHADEVTLLALLSSSGGHWDSSALESLRTIAHRLAVAVERGRHQQRIEQLGRLGHAVSARLEPGAVLQEAVDALPAIFAADGATVALLQEDDTVAFAADFGLEATRGLVIPTSALTSWPSVSAGESFLGEAPPTFWDPSSLWRRCSVLAVPVPGKDSLLATLYLLRSSSRAFSTAARDALMLFSAQLGAALDNAQLYEALRDSQGQLQLITDTISDLVSVFASDGSCVYASPSHLRELGLDPADMVGRTSVVDVIHPEDTDRVLAELAERSAAGSNRRVEYRVRTATGSYLPVETVVSKVSAVGADGAAEERLLLSSRVIAERKALEERLRHAATTDELTGLPNRRRLLELLREALEQAEVTSRERLGLLFLDLDRFKTINDSLGHNAGDQLLVEVTERLLRCLRAAGRSRDVLARLGGDEFVVLLRDLPEDSPDEAADAFAAAVLEALVAPLVLEGRVFEVTASIGVVLPEPGSLPTAIEVLRSADAAMYQAKGHGKARWAVYDADLDRLLRHRLELESDLRGALERDEFALHYQPVVGPGAELVGVEALLRWRHPERGDVPPLEVISLAEETGLLGTIGSWVLRTACAQAAEWNETRRQLGLPPLTMSVNLSPSQLDRGLHDEVLSVLDDTGLAPQRLVLEVTETAYMEPSSSTPEALARLRAAGVRLAIDDFGTGFSSFDRLRRWPADILKIDRSFVAALDDGPSVAAIVQAIISLGKALGSAVVAEGVERSEQAAALTAAGCSRFQGWLYARAQPAEDLRELVSGRERLPDPLASVAPVPQARRAPGGMTALERLR